MRPLLLLLVSALLGGCFFNFDRELGPGEIRGVVQAALVGSVVKPLEGVAVSLDGSTVKTRTDKDGRFVLRRVPGGKWAVRLRYERENDKPLGLVVRDVALEPEDGIDLGHLTVDALGAADGTVTRNGQPARAEVLVPGLPPQVTQPDGSFDFPEMAAGEYRLTVRATTTDGEQFFDGGIFTVRARQRTSALNITLDGPPLPNGRVQSQVRLANQTDHSGVVVEFLGPGKAETLEPSDADGIVGGEIPPGIYRVIARKDGYRPLQVENVVVNGPTNLGNLLLVSANCAPGTTDPACPNVPTDDTDRDGVVDVLDNCPGVSNADQLDVTPQNGLGDVCEPEGSDLTAPAAPVWFMPANPMRVSTPALDLNGRAEAFAKVRLYETACTGTPKAETDAISDGDFSFSVTLEKNRSTVFVVDARDAAGNVSPCSEAFTAIEDETAPDAPSWNAPPPPSKDPSFTFSGRAEPGSTVRLYDTADCSGGITGTATADTTTGAFEFTDVIDFEGTTPRTARAVDAGGLESACSASISLVLDQTPPDVASVVLTVEDVRNGFLGRASDFRMGFTGLPSDRASLKASLSNADDCSGNVVPAFTLDPLATATFNNVPFDDATEYWACLTVVDAAGNGADVVAESFIIDLTPPTTTTLTANGLDLSWPAVTELGSGVAHWDVAWSEDGIMPGTPQQPGLAAATLQFTLVNLTLCRNHTVGVRAVDAAGNTSGWALVDHVLPMPASPANLTVVAGLGTAELTWPSSPGAVTYDACWGASETPCVDGKKVTLGKQLSVRLEGLASSTHVSVRAATLECSGAERVVPYSPLGYEASRELGGQAASDAFGSAIVALDPRIGGGRATFAVGSPNAGGKGRVEVYAWDASGSAPTLAKLLTISGEQAGMKFGATLASLGDFDRDGWNEFAIGLPGFDGSNGTDTGGLDLYSGRTLKRLARVQGPVAGAKFGSAIADAGNVGPVGASIAVPDILVGAPFETLPADGSFPEVIEAGTTDVLDGAFALLGQLEELTFRPDGSPAPLSGLGDGYHFGSAVASAGDLDGDATPDLIIAGNTTKVGTRASAGAVDIVSGVKPHALLAEEQGNAGDLLGTGLAVIGDCDGDGRLDYAAGAPGATSGAGEVRVFSYDALGPGSGVHVHTRVLFTIRGEAAGDGFGTSVNAAGDVDGDGHDDLLVGAPGADHGTTTNTGSVTLVSGASGLPIWIAYGSSAGDALHVTAGVPDGRGDGRPALLLGAPAATFAGFSAGGLVKFATAGSGPNALPAFVPVAGTPAAVGIPVTLAATGAFTTPAFSVARNASGGSITGTRYDAGTTPGWDLLRLTDSAGRSFDRAVEVRATPTYAHTSTWEGRSITSCNLDGTGAPELVIASTTLTGGLLTVWSGTTKLYEFTSSAGGFGASIACVGNIDSTPGDEVAVGAPAGGTLAGSGRVEFFSKTGLLFGYEGAATGEGCGAALVTGDVNGDTQPELMVGCPDAPNGFVRALLLPGRSVIWANQGSPGSRYGSALAYLGQVSGTARGDLAVGAPNEAVTLSGVGFVYLLDGQAGAPFNSFSLPLPFANAHFGTALAAVPDVDGDGFTDVVVTSPGDPANALTLFSSDGIGPIWTVPRPSGFGAFPLALSNAGTLGGTSDLQVLALGTTTGTRLPTVNAYAASGALLRSSRLIGSSSATRAGALAVLPDLDGDGRADWAASTPDDTSPATRAFGSAKTSTRPGRPLRTMAVVTPGAEGVPPSVKLTFDYMITTQFVAEVRKPGGTWQPARASAFAERNPEFTPTAGDAYGYRVRTVDGSDWSPEVWVNVPLP